MFMNLLRVHLLVAPLLLITAFTYAYDAHLCIHICISVWSFFVLVHVDLHHYVCLSLNLIAWSWLRLWLHRMLFCLYSLCECAHLCTLIQFVYNLCCLKSEYLVCPILSLSHSPLCIMITFMSVLIHILLAKVLELVWSLLVLLVFS